MLRAAALAALTLAACRISLESDDVAPTGDAAEALMCKDNTTATSCVNSATHSDLTFIETNIFANNCVFSGCHNGENTPQGAVDLRAGMSHASLVGVTSQIDPTRMLVVPSDLHSSYMMLMLADFPASDATPPGTAPPDDIGFMPQGGDLSRPSILCCQKLGALERWVTAGAMND
ncbi:MAG TPA: hypothetical protein VGM88_34380 [Kofleriaceae bacterium]|jgi:hypothetical protein